VVVSFKSAFVICAYVGASAAQAQEPPPNLLPNPGFEETPDALLGEGRTIGEGKDTFSCPGWWGGRSKGTVRVSGDTRDKAGGKTSLRFDFLDPDTDNEVFVQGRVHGVKPRTIYRLGGKFKVLNVNWVFSFSHTYEYVGDERVGGTGRRTINYPTSSGFEDREVWIITGPKVSWIEVRIQWRGRPTIEGIVRQPSIVWMDDLVLEEIGPVFPPEGDYLAEDFEGKELDGWVLTEIGAHWEPTDPGYGDARSPQISDEQAHSGKQSLKMVPTWGVVTRPFDREVSNCIVTGWFYEVPSTPNDKCRGIVLLADDGKRVGLGTHRESLSNYICYLDTGVKVTDVPKSQAWHEFKFDVTEGEGVVCFIDGVEVGRTDKIDRFSSVQIGEHAWRGSTAFVDDLSIVMKP